MLTDEQRATFTQRAEEGRAYVRLIEGVLEGKSVPADMDAWLRPWVHGPWYGCVPPVDITDEEAADFVARNQCLGATYGGPR